MKGNVVDLAVGVIIGAAFGKIVDSIVKDLIMPIVGKIFGGLDFSNFFILLSNPPADYKGALTYADLSKAGIPLFAYGNFITVSVNFIILAFIIFMMVKQVNRLKASEPPPAPPATPEDVVLLRDIRDALTNRDPREALKNERHDPFRGRVRSRRGPRTARDGGLLRAEQRRRRAFHLQLDGGQP